jgi:hypothetical protein
VGPKFVPVNVTSFPPLVAKVVDGVAVEVIYGLLYASTPPDPDDCNEACPPTLTVKTRPNPTDAEVELQIIS